MNKQIVANIFVINTAANVCFAIVSLLSVSPIAREYLFGFRTIFIINLASRDQFIVVKRKKI